VEIKEKLEELSEAVVFAEPSDIQSIADIHTHFEEIGKWAVDSSEHRVEEATKAAIGILERLILDGIEEVPDKESLLKVISRTVSSLQEIIRDGKKAEDVDFPEELGLCKTSHNPPIENDAPLTEENISRSFPLPPNVDKKIFADFLSRQGAVLQEMEALILRLEKSDDKNKFASLKRLIHTLKGESALMGLSDVEKLCHKIEDLLNEVNPRSDCRYFT